ncbi:YrhC family protein [Neobacillus sp. K501]
MKNQIKILSEKMIDFKRFAVILLTVGVFFYLGVIIPTDIKNEFDQNIMMICSMSFLAVSILFFIESKKCKLKLMDIEEGSHGQK